MRNIELGFSQFYPEDKMKINILSDLMFWVPKICDIENMDPIQACISTKEKKLKDYKDKDNNRMRNENNYISVNEWWLCIEIPMDAYLNPSFYKLSPNFETKYDKIFIVNEFSGFGVKQIK